MLNNNPALAAEVHFVLNTTAQGLKPNSSQTLNGTAEAGALP
jgi:hypothetical protein